MERFNLSNAICKDTFEGRLLIGAMTQVSKDRMLEVFGISPRKEGDGDIHVDVDIRINGVEVPLDAFVEEWRRNRSWFAMKDVCDNAEGWAGSSTRPTRSSGPSRAALEGIIRDEFPDVSEHE